MKKVIRINKPIGITPLQLIQNFKAANPEYKDIKIGYAGRLDPLAHGKMLLLVGEENKNRDKYLNHDKVYITEILLGIKTDSYDLLGIPTASNLTLPNDWLERTKHYLKTITGKSKQKYPPYSTKTVQGKPLFKWAKEGRLPEIELPTREVEIYSAKIISIRTIPKRVLANRIKKSIGLIEGDFRQKEILTCWEDLLTKTPQTTFQLLKIEVDCSTGTYIRSLAHNLGMFLGVSALAYDINRTKIY